MQVFQPIKCRYYKAVKLFVGNNLHFIQFRSPEIFYPLSIKYVTTHLAPPVASGAEGGATGTPID